MQSLHPDDAYRLMMRDGDDRRARASSERLARPMRPERPRRVGGVPRRTLAVTGAAAFLVSLDLSIVNVAFPAMRASFAGTSTATLSWVLSAYSVVFGALLLGAGRMADRSGRRRWFQRGLVVFALGSVACAGAPTVTLLIAGRVVQAIGAAFVMPAALGLLLARCPANVRTQAVSLFGGLSALAVAVGPSLGALLIEAAGWRSAFVINLPLVVIVLVAVRAEPIDGITSGRAPDALGIVLIGSAVAALALAVSQGQAWGWTSPAVLIAFAAAGVLGAVALARCARHPSPAIDLRVLRQREAAAANAATFLYAVGFFGLLLSSILFLNTVWSYSTLRAGLAITPAPLIVTALAGRTGRLAARVGFRPVLVAGGLVIGAADVWFVLFTGQHSRYLVGWLPGALLLGVGVALSFPVMSAAAVAGLPPDRYSIGGAMNQTARQLGAVFGVAVFVAILGVPLDAATAVHRFHVAWLVCATTAVGSSAVSLLHGSRAQRRVLGPELDVSPARQAA